MMFAEEIFAQQFVQDFVSGVLEVVILGHIMLLSRVN
jgi:hypothetical protein